MPHLLQICIISVLFKSDFGSWLVRMQYKYFFHINSTRIVNGIIRELKSLISNQKQNQFLPFVDGLILYDALIASWLFTTKSLSVAGLDWKISLALFFFLLFGQKLELFAGLWWNLALNTLWCWAAELRDVAQEFGRNLKPLHIPSQLLSVKHHWLHCSLAVNKCMCMCFCVCVCVCVCVLS